MSSRNLKRQARTVLNDMNAISARIRKEVYRRSHILVMNSRSGDLQRYIESTFENIGSEPPLRGKALVHAFMDYHIKHAPRTWEISDRRYSSGRVLSMKATSFGSFSTWKTNVLPGFFYGGLSEWKKFTKEEKASRRKGITGEGGVGLHLGHLGDSVVSVTASEVVTTKKTESTDRLKLIKDLQKIRAKFGLEGKSQLKVTRTGHIKKNADFRIIYEAAEENLGKSSLEKALSNEMKKYLTEVAFGESSRSISTALLDTLEDALKHGRVVRTGTEKGRVNDSIQSSSTVPVTTYKAFGQRKGKRRSSRVYDDFAVNNYINAKLTNEVISRMGSPRLNYRTGRFADSVKVARSRKEPKSGVVTIEYTYQRAPYEVFERGNSDMATPQRDPRLVIGESIRAIAKELAIKKMNLRRI